MPEYLILRLPANGDPRQATITQFASATDVQDAARQGYTGDGRYVVLSWDGREEFDLVPGGIEVRPPT